MTQEKVPLVVDLDGTIVNADTLVLSVLQLLRKSPLNFLRMFLWLPTGRVNFKRKVSLQTELPVADLPYRTDLLQYLIAQKKKGRRIILATAAHITIADKVARHLDIFDGVIATDRGINVKGRNKLEAIKRTIGDNFVYAGDSKADLPIWRFAEAAILVNVKPALSKRVCSVTRIEAEFT